MTRATFSYRSPSSCPSCRRRASAGLAVSRQLLRRIVEATQGNPLFVLEVGRSLIELGTPSVADEIPLPDDGDAPEHGASAACLGAERLTREGTPVESVA